MISKDAVWFITGCSRGLGRALAQQTLTSGYRVAVTALRTADVADIVAEHSDRALAVELDVTKTDQIQAAVTVADEPLRQRGRAREQCRVRISRRD